MKFITKAAATVAASALIVLGTAIPSFATHPAVVVAGVCNPATDKVDLSATVTGDPGYPSVKGKIVSESIAFFPSFVGHPVKGSSGKSSTAVGLDYATKYVLKIGVQFENHSDGDIVYNEGSYTPNFRSCSPADKLDATASVVVTPATCESAGVPSFAIENAVWDDETDTTDGSRTATALPGHRFADNTTTATVAYVLEPKLSQNEPPCKTNKPDDIVEVVVTISEPDCVTNKVTKTTTTTTIGSEYDPVTNTWPRTTPVVVSVPEFIDLTSDELRDCTPKPEDESSYVDTRETDCERGDVTVHRATTNVTSEWNGTAWDRIVDVVLTDFVDEKTAAEIEDCIVVVKPPVKHEGSLAITGADPWPPIMGAGIILLIAAALLTPTMVEAYRRRKASVTN